MNKLIEKSESVRSLTRAIVRRFGVIRNFCNDLDVTPAEGHILLEIYSKDAMSIKELTEIMFLDKSTLSRTVKKLIDKKYLETNGLNKDKRYKYFSLSKNGNKQVETINCKYNQLVGNALSFLDVSEVENLIFSLSKFQNALAKAQSRNNVLVRELEKKDEKLIRQIIKAAVAEFGETEEELLLMCPEIEYLYKFYRDSKGKYFILEKNNEILGGAGIRLLKGEKNICELQKMYIAPQHRGLGLGKLLLEKCIEEARKLKYSKVYLDTRDDMTKAIRMYKKFGFKDSKKPIELKGHFLCTKCFVYELK